MANRSARQKVTKRPTSRSKPFNGLSVRLRAKGEEIESLGGPREPGLSSHLIDLVTEIWTNLRFVGMGREGEFELLVVTPESVAGSSSQVFGLISDVARKAIGPVLAGESHRAEVPMQHALDGWIFIIERDDTQGMHAKQVFNKLRNALEEVKAQARGDDDLRQESAELLEEALGELRMPAVEGRAPADKTEQPPPSQEPLAPETKPTKEQSLLREGDPLIEAFAKFWDERAALSRDQRVEGFQTLLNQFHERQTLGTFELNRAATQWVNFISKKLKIVMFSGNESVRIMCTSGIPQGYFVLCRTSGKGAPLPGTGSKTFPRLSTLSLSDSHVG